MAATLQATLDAIEKTPWPELLKAEMRKAARALWDDQAVIDAKTARPDRRFERPAGKSVRQSLMEAIAAETDWDARDGIEVLAD
jgi:hypothetical protein